MTANTGDVASGGKNSQTVKRRAAVILAAGKGTRMHSTRSKVLHEVGGRSSLAWVVDGARSCGCSDIFLVVGPESDELRAAFAGQADLHWVEQTERLGTGHALQVAVDAMSAAGVAESCVLVLYADAPLVTQQTMLKLLDEAEAGFGSLSFATLDEPGNLGRVRADSKGQLQGIVEVADATPEELEIKLVNAGHYALPFPGIQPYLDDLEPGNQQGEFYLTDAVVAAASTNRVRCVELADPSEAWGINDRADLARVHQAFCQRAIRQLQDQGVTFLQPQTTTVDATVEVAADVTVYGGVNLLGSTTIGSGSVIHHGAWIKDSIIAEDCEVRPYSVVENATLSRGAGVGPFARLRGGVELDEDVQIGNFVEIKKSKLGRGVKAGHLAYLGDAEIGAKTNIGAGVVTCNYDGVNKHQTKIGEAAFVGSDSMLVAPVKLGDGATTAAGSTITNDVPAGALAVGRARQRNIEGWAERQASLRRAKKGEITESESLESEGSSEKSSEERAQRSSTPPADSTDSTDLIDSPVRK